MRYALAFLLAAVGLTVGAIATFVHISSVSLVAAEPASAAPAADTVPAGEVATPLTPTSTDYARYAEADRVWRERHARQYTIAELRARGDGRRTPREAMQDRVFNLTRRGDRAGAITELEQWVRGHPRDEESLLALARLLNEVGRTGDAVARYREILALHSS
ncbi:MAG: tetratricopeptide repeat protein [Gemmatimonadaceae bacterium]